MAPHPDSTGPRVDRPLLAILAAAFALRVHGLLRHKSFGPLEFAKRR